MPEKRINRLIKIFLIILIAQIFGFEWMDGKQNSRERLIQELDSLLQQREEKIREKEDKIADLKETLKETHTDGERFVYTNLLIKEYSGYNIDEALEYGRQLQEIINRQYPDSTSLRDETKLKIADFLVMQGNFEEADKILNGIDKSNLSPDNKAYFFEVKEHFAITKGVFMRSRKMNWDEVLKEINTYRDSILSISGRDSERWIWVPLAKKIDTAPETLREEDADARGILDYMERHPKPSALNAQNAYWLSRFYNTLGNKQEELKYLLESARINEQLLNRDIVTYQALSRYFIEEGDISKAFEYVVYAILNANALKNRSRVVDILKQGVRVGNAYYKEKQAIEKANRHLIVALVIISSILLISFCVIIYFLIVIRKKKESLQQQNFNITHSNRQLRQDLDKKNEEFAKIGEEKLQFEINLERRNQIITTCLIDNSNFYEFFEKYRHELLKLFRERNSKELGIMLNDPELLKDMVQEFNKNFDKTLLTLYPDFVNQYNLNVAEDLRVDVRTVMKQKILNTRMRVFALMLAGMEKGKDIAKVLHISPQTVYNIKTELGKGEK